MQPYVMNQQWVRIGDSHAIQDEATAVAASWRPSR
jgi:hypothetical protein